MSRQIKTIGIVGGLGPESTIEYYRQIIAEPDLKSFSQAVDTDQHSGSASEKEP